MSGLNFESKINATKEKVWETLWGDSTYRKWTAAFTEGSYAKSDWKEGSKIFFLNEGGNGIFSVIQTKKPNEQMTFQHLGEVKNGIEVPKGWKNATENYNLVEQGDATELTVSLTLEDEPGMADYFNATFPKALAILKDLAEQ